MDELKKQPDSLLAEAKNKSVVIEVNKRPVTLKKKRVTGLLIKQAAVDQRVPHVTVDFLLMLVRKEGGVQAVGDDEVIVVTKKSKFKMVAADDNSEY
jgi:hypothetical protein